MTKHWYWISYIVRRGSEIQFSGCAMWFGTAITEDEHVEQLVEILAGKENANVSLLAFSPLRTETAPDPAAATS